jgi:hypothetical protein
MVIQGKVTAGDAVDTSILLDLPVSKAQTLGLSEEVSLRDLATPVSFGSLLEVTVLAHTGETENSGLNHLADCSMNTNCDEKWNLRDVVRILFTRTKFELQATSFRAWGKRGAGQKEGQRTRRMRGWSLVVDTKDPRVRKAEV